MTDIKTNPPGYGDAQDTRMYHLHTPFNPGQSTNGGTNVSPVYTSGGGTPGDGRQTFVSYDGGLGDSPGMTTCTSCQQQVMTNVTYKAGTYAWLMCLLFICCGLFCCCCLIPFFLNKFKDAYHTCPRCNRVLHVNKKQCCK